MLSISRMKSVIYPTFSTFSAHLSNTPSLRLYFPRSQPIPCNSPTLQNPNFFLKPTMVSFTSPSASISTQNRRLQSEVSQYPSGEIHVIVGPMFAGKTTTLLRRIQSESDNGRFQASSHKYSLHLDKTLKGLCYSGRFTDAVGLLCRTGLQVEPPTYALLLQECIFRKEFKKGRRIHTQMIIVGFVPDEYLKIKLLIFYAKAGDLEAAHILFNKLLNKSLISWNTMISGQVQKGFHEVGLSFYHEMRRSGLTPDQFTFASVFRAYASLAILEEGKQAHAVMVKCKMKENVVVNSALMDMYFKCSSPDDGHRVFDKSLDRNVITWTALISGYGLLGRFEEVLEFFHRMKSEGFRPNHVTFLAVLCACSHAGLVSEGWEYFSSMIRDYCVHPRGKHYAAIVDLLGRAGRLDEAYEFVQISPCKEHSVIWGALLGACRMHGNIDLLKLAAKKYSELEPEIPDKYVVLSNAYATFGLWDNVADVRGAMKELGLKKEPAYSRIEVQSEVHFFFMGDKSNKESERIYTMIKEMTYILKDAGYVPDLSSD